MKGRKRPNPHGDKKNLVIKENGQDYAKVTKTLGHCNYRVICASDDTERIGHIRGSLSMRMGRKRQLIREGTWLLVSLRDFQDERCDIIHRYADDEVAVLIKRGEISEPDQACDVDVAFDKETPLDDISNQDFTVDEI